MKFSIVAAMDENSGIGLNNSLPWRLKEDMAFFKNLTTKTKDPTKKNAVIMGRNTWESIPEKYRPLPDRHNIVLTRQEGIGFSNGACFTTAIDKALEVAEDMGAESAFIIGGAEIYAQCINLKDCDDLYLTKIEGDFLCDTVFPPLNDHWLIADESERREEKGIGFKFIRYHWVL